MLCALCESQPLPIYTTLNATRVTICVLFCAIETSDYPFQASPLGVYKAESDHFSNLRSSSSELSCSAPSTPEKEMPLPESMLYRRVSDRAFWLQRQNSLSSRNAIYPPCLRSSSIYSRPSPGSLRSSSAPQFSSYRYGASSPFHRSLTSSSSTTTTTPLPSVLESSDSVSFPTRASSSVSSSSTDSRKSPLSTMRRVSQPDVPIIPNRFQSVSSTGNKSWERRSSFPFAWSPFLHHTPLSADPAIRALSIAHDVAVPVSPAMERDVVRGSSVTMEVCPMERALVADVSATPPALPRRSRGHTIPVRK